MAMTQRDASRQNWNCGNTVEEINSGCLQRIADATEVMAKNHVQMQNDLDMYKRWYHQERETVTKLNARIRGLRGVITRLKNNTNK